MSGKNKKIDGDVIITEIIAILAIWLYLIIIKSLGWVSWHWAIVLSGIVWISWLWFAFTALVVLIYYALAKLKRRLRRRKIDRRIIRQAEAVGVWDKPQCLGGRALELKAWQDFKIKRRPGEKDAELRKRCMTAADNEYAEQIAKVYDYETAKTKRRRKK